MVTKSGNYIFNETDLLLGRAVLAPSLLPQIIVRVRYTRLSAFDPKASLVSVAFAASNLRIAPSVS